ncbi:uncharacterized protein tp53i13 isoform X2 [Silurus meridionalis]|uniref:uncharacterized protein tp53i13 isoform X2 n=1 Tax=Silurus meridionalis TaxID=175797 RepID=UPI001EEC7926|nr:uncharacterized protein tp53i13 isoform X2 [Silurus meridionalis]
MTLRVEVLIWGLVWLSMIRCSSGLPQHCDNGKAKLETDLPSQDEFLCQKPWSQTSPALLHDISTKYSLKPAESVCMDLHITYSHTIPNSGAHRPVGAQSGEYLYCPPQRWINNLKDGATVLLFHPCASENARRSLAAVAHSCLPHFILTPYPQLSQQRPFALVSWGHTLEMSHVTTSGVCEWLHTVSTSFNQTTVSQSRNYNLYLTKAASVDRALDISEKSLKACCVEVLSAYETTARTRKRQAVLQPAKREINEEEVTNSGKPSSNDSEKNMLNHTHTQPLNNSESTDSLSTGLHGHVLTPFHTAIRSEERGGGGGGGGGGVETDTKTTATQLPLKEPLGYSRDEETVEKIHDSQTALNSLKKINTMAVRKQRIKTDVAELSAGGGCADPGHCGPPDVATAVIEGPLRGRKMIVQRSDEAVWAAAALGFLLVLLTLSVLHTRLYRNCRAPSSLYWPESQQDYESVSDIIRRRLRMVSRRKRRASQSRRQERPLLSDSSSDNE